MPLHVYFYLTVFLLKLWLIKHWLKGRDQCGMFKWLILMQSHCKCTNITIPHYLVNFSVSNGNNTFPQIWLRDCLQCSWFLIAVDAAMIYKLNPHGKLMVSVQYLSLSSFVTLVNWCRYMNIQVGNKLKEKHPHKMTKEGATTPDSVHFGIYSTSFCTSTGGMDTILQKDMIALMWGFDEGGEERCLTRQSLIRHRCSTRLRTDDCKGHSIWFRSFLCSSNHSVTPPPPCGSVCIYYIWSHSFIQDLFFLICRPSVYFMATILEKISKVRLNKHSHYHPRWLSYPKLLYRVVLIWAICSQYLPLFVK